MLKSSKKIGSVSLELASTIVALIGAIGSIVAVLFAMPNDHKITALEQRQALLQAEAATVSARAEMQEARAEIADFRAQLQAISKSKNSDLVNGELQEIRSRIVDLDKRQSQIESVILTNPEKALSAPLLRRDIDAQKEANAQAVAAVKASVDQVYDITKWLLGTMAVSIFGLAFSTFFRLNHKDTISQPSHARHETYSPPSSIPPHQEKVGHDPGPPLGLTRSLPA